MPLSSDLEITAFCLEPTSPLGVEFPLDVFGPYPANLCPMHGLHHGSNRFLFVHWDEGRAHCPVLKRWIISCLMEAIPSTYYHQGQGHEILRANPHSIWGVAASWAEIARVLASAICHIATWFGTCTFTQFFWLGFPGSSFGSAVLETIACV